MDVVGIIPARYSSSRFEGKVLADIAGKTMLERVWVAARQALTLDELIIACDDERIAKVAKGFGANVVLTAKGHASGTDRICEVVNPLDVKVVVNIQADEPLIAPSMIDSLARTLLEDPSAMMATLIKAMDEPEIINDPNVVKVVIDKNNYAVYFSRAPIPFKARNSSIEVPLYFKHIGIYAYTKDFLYTYKNLPVSYLERVECLEQLRVLEAGFRIKVIETKQETIGVDTPEDLQRVVEYLKSGHIAPVINEAPG